MLRTKASVIDIYSSKILLWYNSTDMIFKKPIEVIVFALKFQKATDNASH
jgi:hypothetical protein